jgi:hypothetical protein
MKVVMKKKKTSVLDWLIAARGYAMFGVFLGHVMIAYILAGYSSLIEVGKFLEPVFVPFFVILVGAFHSPSRSSFRDFVVFKAYQRLFPVYFYTVLVIPFLLFLTIRGNSLVPDWNWLWAYVFAVPVFSWPAWFLVALFSSELLYYFILPRVHSKRDKLILAAILFIVGWVFNWAVNQTAVALSYVVMLWMVHAVLLFCSLFLLGSVLRRQIINMSYRSRSSTALLFVFALSGLIVSANNNSFASLPQGSFRMLFDQNMVVISIGQYGELLPFFGSIIFGALALLCFCRLMPMIGVMRIIGEQSLVLLGLNCLFHAVFNRFIVRYFHPAEDQLAWVMLYAFTASVLSIALCLPVALLLQRYLPQLTGKPMLKGPVLPALYRKNTG